MMNGISQRRAAAYPAAGIVAAKVHDYFARHRRSPQDGHGPSASTIADVDTIEGVIDAAFWASLRREEGYVPKISIAIVARETVAHALVFERALPLTPSSLVRVSPAVERPGLHLAVWRNQNDLQIWGTARAVPPSSCVIEVVAPGLLVIKYRPSEHSGKFVNIAMIEGDQIKFVDERASAIADCPALVATLLGFDGPSSQVDSVNVLVELAASMRGHGRGGSLLIVPAGTSRWRESIVHPMLYSVSPPFLELAEAVRQDLAEESGGPWNAKLRRAIEIIAGLTAVDGATVLSGDYELIAFGAKIAQRAGFARVEQVAVTEPIEGVVAEVVNPVQLGGTRHLSAAQFVQDQRDALALVASQDGRFTVFAWSVCDDLVHAHRVDALLM
jgi:hypothetical protein